MPKLMSDFAHVLTVCFAAESGADLPMTPVVDAAGSEPLTNGSGQTVDKELSLVATRKLTLLDMFRHRRLRFNALISFLAWSVAHLPTCHSGLVTHSTPSSPSWPGQ